MENSTKVSVKTELPYDPAIPLLGVYPKEKKTGHLSKRYLHSHAYCSIVYNSQDMEKTNCPSVGDWIKKMWYVKMLSEISQTEKDKYSMISLSCGI